MRLLVTNCRVAQAYATLRALRPHAEHVVATTSGKRPLGVWPTCHAAYSRLVDRRYNVPDPESDWFHGRIGPQNTEQEEAFIRAIEEICRTERIDAVFPTNDAWVYVFSKNRDRLAELGVTVPVPDFEVVKRPLDKHETVQAAIESGFPHPRTYLAVDDAAVREAVADLPPPWVVKLRFTNGGRGMSFHWDSEELLQRTRELREVRGAPIVQEFIPDETLSFYTVLDKEGRLLSCLTPANARDRLGRPSHAARNAFLTAPRHEYAEQAAALARHVGWWGSLTIQAKLDDRDGIPKILEINPRLGVHLWLRTEVGVNEPLMALRIARGEPVDPVPEVPAGISLLKPIEDTIAFSFDSFDYGVWKVRRLIGGKSVERSLPQDSFRQLWDDYRGPYRGDGERRYSPYYQYFREDPVPSLIWTSKLLAANGALSAKRLFSPGRVKRPV